MSEQTHLEQANAIVDQAIAEHKPRRIYTLFSGGEDSKALTVFMAKRPEFSGCVHIDTGVGIPETGRFVREICERQKWPLIVLRTDPAVYDDQVMQCGFPGPAMHGRFYNMLKERRLREITAASKEQYGDRVMFLTGVRRDESRRRMGTTQEINREGARVWVAPLANWPKAVCKSLCASENLPVNPVSQELGMSGECLCGAMAEPGELAKIDRLCPSLTARFDRLGEECAKRGKWPHWGDPPHETDKAEMHGQQSFLPLCSSCEWRREGRQVRQGDAAETAA